MSPNIPGATATCGICQTILARNDCMDEWNHTRIFPSIFYCRYSVVKTQSSIEFQNPIFHPFHFNNIYFIAVVKLLFIIHCPLEKHFKEGYIFSVFFLFQKCVFQQSSSFQIAKFLQPFMAHHGGALSVTSQNKQ